MVLNAVEGRTVSPWLRECSYLPCPTSETSELLHLSRELGPQRTKKPQAITMVQFVLCAKTKDEFGDALIIFTALRLLL
jgi:hypothetical protein